jgi:periplasmic divalent cation tolerance protein
MEDTSPCVVLVSAASEASAADIAHALVAEGLAACCSIVPHIRSVYSWQGAVHDESESLLVCKTVRCRFPALEARVRAMHTYDIPEILLLPVTEGSAPYLSWLLETCTVQSGGNPEHQGS